MSGNGPMGGCAVRGVVRVVAFVALAAGLLFALSAQSPDAPGPEPVGQEQGR